MQSTIVEGKVILSKFWHKYFETNENMCQKDQGVLIKVGQNSNAILRLLDFICRMLLNSNVTVWQAFEGDNWSTTLRITLAGAMMRMPFIGW